MLLKRLQSQLLQNYSLLTISKKPNSLINGRILLTEKPKINVHPTKPVRTRFAPSPTGLMHMGSLRTALYNYLLAKNTKGQFLLRLEDTDQKRLVPEAEQDIYDTLKWCNIQADEGPHIEQSQYGPYRQSDRKEIYQKHIKTLLDNGHAYRCFCNKDRLENLKNSAKLLKPPTTVSYDRHCYHLSKQDIEQKLAEKCEYTIRFKSPEKYPTFTDLLHKRLDIQPQINLNDRRYDDPILMKSDNLPTYHFANVVDDHLMEITHVIRGEEWMPSTPKHLAIYNAFGWTAPEFVHIPLLTTLSDKKLSKRKNDASITAMKKNGVLPEALINFCVLLGWSPPRELSYRNHECFDLNELEKLFDLNYLTKGNAKVDEKKLWFFNKHHLQLRLQEPTELEKISDHLISQVQAKYHNSNVTKSKIKTILKTCGNALTTINEFSDTFQYFFNEPALQGEDRLKDILLEFNGDLNKPIRIMEYCLDELTLANLSEIADLIQSKLGYEKKATFRTLRWALSNSQPGVKIPNLIEILTLETTKSRLKNAIEALKKYQLSLKCKKLDNCT